VTAISQDATTIYWSVGAQIWSWPKDATATPSLLMQAPSDVLAVDWIASSGTDMIFAEETQAGTTRFVRRTAAGNVLLLHETPTAATTFTLDAQLLYWAEPNVIRRLAVDGSSQPEDVARWASLPVAVAILVDGDRLYWVTHDASNHDALYVAPTCGGRVRLIDSFYELLLGATLDAQFIYWGGSDGIARVAK
jgi:hypothetical protein